MSLEAKAEQTALAFSAVSAVLPPAPDTRALGASSEGPPAVRPASPPRTSDVSTQDTENHSPCLYTLRGCPCRRVRGMSGRVCKRERKATDTHVRSWMFDVKPPCREEFRVKHNSCFQKHVRGPRRTPAGHTAEGLVEKEQGRDPDSCPPWLPLRAADRRPFSAQVSGPLCRVSPSAFQREAQGYVPISRMGCAGLTARWEAEAGSLQHPARRRAERRTPSALAAASPQSRP